MCAICKTLCICASFFSWCPPCLDTSLVSSTEQDGLKAAQQALLGSDRCLQAPAAALHHGRSTNMQGNHLFALTGDALTVLFLFLCSYHEMTAETAVVQAKRPPPPASTHLPLRWPREEKNKQMHWHLPEVIFPVSSLGILSQLVNLCARQPIW